MFYSLMSLCESYFLFCSVLFYSVAYIVYNNITSYIHNKYYKKRIDIKENLTLSEYIPLHA